MKGMDTGMTYYYVSSKGKIEEDTWADTQTDRARLNFGNAFKERQMAQDHLKQIQRTAERSTERTTAA